MILCFPMIDQVYARWRCRSDDCAVARSLYPIRKRQIIPDVRLAAPGEPRSDIARNRNRNTEPLIFRNTPTIRIDLNNPVYTVF